MHVQRLEGELLLANNNPFYNAHIVAIKRRI